jgi:hypothetical protein
LVNTVMNLWDSNKRGIEEDDDWLEEDGRGLFLRKILVITGEAEENHKTPHLGSCQDKNRSLNSVTAKLTCLKEYMHIS